MKAALALCLALLPAAASGRDLNSELAGYGLAAPAAWSLPLKDSRRDKAGELVFHEFWGEKGTRRAEFEAVGKIGPGEAARLLESRYAVMADLYDPKAIPYGGAVTNRTECPPEARPVEFEAAALGVTVKVVLGWASRRYALGVWEKKDAYRSAGFLVFYDKAGRTLFQVVLFDEPGRLGEAAVKEFLSGLKRTAPSGGDPRPR